jgi:uncharacterized protein (DUF302 family)
MDDIAAEPRRIDAVAMKRELGIRTVIDIPFEEALVRTRAALPVEGFGVITEIDVRRTMKEKLNLEVAPYVILGACNPQLAHRALTAEPEAGLLLPCNVIVYADGKQRTVIEAVNPMTMIGLMDDGKETRAVAEEARVRLERVIESLAPANIHA